MKKIIFLCISFFSAQGIGADQYGRASFYGDQYQGRPTASGEIFDQGKLTGAHRTLPFGTKVRVTNLSNNRQIEVLINDRGPFVQGRIIDLSRTAAESLEMITAGTIQVKMEILSPSSTTSPPATVFIPPPPRDETPMPAQTFPVQVSQGVNTPQRPVVSVSTTPVRPVVNHVPAEIFIQTASFQDRNKAQSAAIKLRTAGHKPQIWENSGLYRVGIPAMKKDENDLKSRLKTLGISAPLVRSSLPPGKETSF